MFLPRQINAILFLGLLAASMANCACAGVMHGIADSIEQCSVEEALDENALPAFEVSEPGDSMNQQYIGSSSQSVLAANNQDRLFLDEVSEPLVLVFAVDFQEPMAMELLKVPIQLQ